MSRKRLSRGLIMQNNFMRCNKKRLREETAQMLVKRNQEIKDEYKNVIKRQKYMNQFQLMKAEKIIEYMSENQLNFEKQLYTVNRKFTNKLADYGFVIYEDKELRNQRLVKISGDLLIQVTYDIKQRRRKPGEKIGIEDHEKAHEVQINHLMKALPALKERQSQFDESTAPLFQEDRHFLEGEVDPPEDMSFFDIVIINKKKNEAIKFLCTCEHQKVNIRNITYSNKADIHAKTYNDLNEMRNIYCPKFDSLSTKLQKRFVEYLYSLGIPPDIGLIAEFMAINKEERMYMDWLKNMKDII